MISKKHILIFVSIFFASCLITKAQDTDTEPLKNEGLDIKLETSGTFTSGDYAPFWLTNNNYGIGSEKDNNGYLRVNTKGYKKLFNDKLNVSLGVDIIGSHNLQTDFYFHQWYVDLRYRSLGLSAGAKERNNPFKNKDLSTGGLTLSNNARPIPQIEVGFPDFVPIPLTNDWLHIQGGISYGWFLDDKYKKHHAKDGNYAQDALYHRKYMYLKVEKNSPFSFILGLEMDTQWGGEFFKNHSYKGNSPGSFKNFFKVLVPMEGGSDSSPTDQVNVIGNVFGSWHFILNYKKENYEIKAYHEHFFEDHSGVIFKNIPDGIYGVEFNLKRKFPISSILFEYIHTKNQSGPFLWDKTPEIPIQVSADDNYYNHAEYISTSYYGFVLGNPLLTSPIYNNKETLNVRNSRIIAFHGGIGGYVTNDLNYRALVTYSRSWGTPGKPSIHIKNQFSSLLELNYSNPKLTGWLFSGAFAYDDSATMVGDNTGFRMKISKTFHVK